MRVKEGLFCVLMLWGKLLHLYSVRPGGPCGESGIEIEVEPWIQFQMVFVDFDHVHFVITFEMNFAEVVLVQEIIRDDQPLVVVAESNGVRTRIQPQVHDSGLERCLRVADVEHSYLPRLERSKQETVAAF